MLLLFAGFADVRGVAVAHAPSLAARGHNAMSLHDANDAFAFSKS
jgi:hypothetical protein